MIELSQTSPCWGLPDISPFCIKLHTYLRIAKIPYQATRELLFQNAPKGKIPYIKYNGELIGDSNLIIEFLKNNLGVDPDEILNKEERAIALAFRRLSEENLYWAIGYCYYMIPEAWQSYKTILGDLVFSQLPEPIRHQQLEQLRDEIIKQFWGHGIGRHSLLEVIEIGKRDLSALSDFLGDKPYFMGAKLTTLDASTYGLLSRLIYDSIESPLKEYALSFSNLKAYCDRIRAELYTEEETQAWQL